MRRGRSLPRNFDSLWGWGRRGCCENWASLPFATCRTSEATFLNIPSFASGRLEGGIRASRPGRASHELRQLHVRDGQRGAARHADDRVQPPGRFRRWRCDSWRSRRFCISGLFAWQSPLRLAGSRPRSARRGQYALRSTGSRANAGRMRRGAEIVWHLAMARVARSVTFGASGRSLDEVFAMKEAHRNRIILLEAGDAQHAVGTCRKTRRTETSGVVNPDGSVEGVQYLRVADTSVMPFDYRANTHFTSVMIGEVVRVAYEARGLKRLQNPKQDASPFRGMGRDCPRGDQHQTQKRPRDA